MKLEIKWRNPEHKNPVALGNLDLGAVTIYGCSIMSGKNGYFLKSPERKGKDDKYFPIVHFSEDTYKKVNAFVDKEMSKEGSSDLQIPFN